MELYEKIGVLRKKNSLTQSEFADKLNVTRQAVYKWESGITSPDISKIVEIAELFHTTTDFLLNDKLSIEELESKIDRKSNTLEVKNQRRSMLDYLLLVPFLLGVAIFVFMFVCFGAMLIGFLFAFSLMSFAAPFYGLIMLFNNASNGTGAICISIGIIFAGIGGVYPMFILGRLWYRQYLIWHKAIFKKIKSIRWKEVLY